jgi:hypothetical protein
MKSNIWVLRLGVILVFLMIIGPIMAYRSQFGGVFSNGREVWGQFGDFLNVFVSISNLVFISILTYFIYSNQQKDENERNKPVLIFKLIKVKEVYWELQNVGKGPAINILMSKSKIIDQWDKPTIVYALKEGDSFKTSISDEITLLSASYQDNLGNVFSSICKNGITEFVRNIDILESNRNDFNKPGEGDFILADVW